MQDAGWSQLKLDENAQAPPARSWPTPAGSVEGDQTGWSDGHIDGSWPNWNDSHTYPDNSSHWITYSWAGGPFYLNEYHPWYDTSEFLQAWRLLLNASDDLSDQQPYVWDVVDVTREVLSKFVFTFYVNATTNAYLAKDVHALSKAGDALLELMDDLDDLLGSCEGWLLGAWITDARANAMGEPAPTRAAVADRWEYNARLLITTWGGGISDYANKFWSGLIGDYYKGRWERWLAMLADNLRNDIPLSYHDHGLIDQAWTEEWTANRMVRHLPDDPLWHRLRGACEKAGCQVHGYAPEVRALPMLPRKCDTAGLLSVQSRRCQSEIRR